MCNAEKEVVALIHDERRQARIDRLDHADRQARGGMSLEVFEIDCAASATSEPGDRRSRAPVSAARGRVPIMTEDQPRIG